MIVAPPKATESWVHQLQKAVVSTFSSLIDDLSALQDWASQTWGDPLTCRSIPNHRALVIFDRPEVAAKVLKQHFWSQVESQQPPLPSKSLASSESFGSSVDPDRFPANRKPAHQWTVVSRKRRAKSLRQAMSQKMFFRQEWRRKAVGHALAMANGNQKEYLLHFSNSNSNLLGGLRLCLVVLNVAFAALISTCPSRSLSANPSPLLEASFHIAPDRTVKASLSDLQPSQRVVPTIPDIRRAPPVLVIESSD
ncbi:hypothetical protein AMTR_s00028p00152950 [Amborella trichopoda]|uniref:Uncharacterized protein n=1 Tax=Amborella trichopoda TaxID=13333 RepID=W1PSC3_AMBTC|nr:hypothetical protein AMTR_s00028p00152950 [Amborella trichopoda]